MSGNGNQVPLAPNQRGPGPYPRAPTPHRTECYHPSGGTGAGFMQSSGGGAQPAPQPGLRAQPAQQQQSAPPAPPQDMTKNSMSGHSFVAPQSQTPQTRPQYHNYQFRPSQHGTRPNAHPRNEHADWENIPKSADQPKNWEKTSTENL